MSFENPVPCKYMYNKTFHGRYLGFIRLWRRMTFSLTACIYIIEMVQQTFHLLNRFQKIIHNRKCSDSTVRFKLTFWILANNQKMISADLKNRILVSLMDIVISNILYHFIFIFEFIYDFSVWWNKFFNQWFHALFVGARGKNSEDLVYTAQCRISTPQTNFIFWYIRY